METAENCYRRFLEGDERAFDVLVDTYRPGLIYFINSYVHEIHTAEDIAIDCFVYLITHPGRYNFKTPLKTYLYVLGRSRALDWLRRQKRLKAVTEEEAESGFPETDAVFSDYIDTQLKKELHTAIRELPEDMKNAVILFYFDSLSYSEIAKILHKKPKQIDNMLFRAREKLKSMLKDEGGTL